MAQTVELAVSAPKAIGIETWMQRVLERANKLSSDWAEDDIHDLRVAMRRCRTMAETLSQVNPDPLWRKVKKSTGDLFHSLGALRDTQVERAWLKKLWPAGDKVRARLMRELSRRQKEQQAAAERRLAEFDHKSWKKWSRKIGPKEGFFPIESVVFQRLALAQLNDCIALVERARRGPSAAAWHRARIGLKKFRYIAENFLPRRYEAWAADVKKLQDLLGEVHDLDVLRIDVRKMARANREDASAHLEKLQAERKARLAEGVARTTGSGSVFPMWLAGLPLSHSWRPRRGSLPAARLGATSPASRPIRVEFLR